MSNKFTTINSFRLYSLFSNRFYCNNDSNDSCLALKSPKNLPTLFNEFNSFSSDFSNTPENVINSNYYDIDLLQTFTNRSSFFLSYEHLLTLKKNR